MVENIEEIIGKCAEGLTPQHKEAKEEKENYTYYCPLCSKTDYCLYINKERLLEVRNEDEAGWKYSYFYECLRPFVRTMQKRQGGKGRL